MVASGVPSRNGDAHVTEIARLSLQLIHSLERTDSANECENRMRLRLGFHTGRWNGLLIGIVIL